MTGRPTIQERARAVAGEAWDRRLTPREALEAVDRAFQGRHALLRLRALLAATRFLLFRDRNPEGNKR